MIILESAKQSVRLLSKNSVKSRYFGFKNIVKSENVVPFARTKNQIGFIPILFLDCDVGREPERVAI